MTWAAPPPTSATLAAPLQEQHGLCKGKKCLAPKPCPNLQADHREYLDILRAPRQVDGVKKVFIRSGIRYDYLLCDPDDSFFRELVQHHVSGQLKVAPEHCSAAVLDKMGKPHIEAYIEFSRRYFTYTGQIQKEQYLVPYLMSSHPGSRLDDAIELACFLKKIITFARSRCRTFIPPRVPSPPVCSIRSWIRTPWSRSMWQRTPATRHFSGHCFSIIILRTTPFVLRHCVEPIVQI